MNVTRDVLVRRIHLYIYTHIQSKSSQRIPLNHSDFCHDISYNFFGDRLAVRRRFFFSRSASGSITIFFFFKNTDVRFRQSDQSVG